ncbi:TRAP transporter large permease [Pseudogracilibacillus auburnensis]|uniref:Tripartite ATP-independent transporter DctM subunit n=1 Tax=Pseudogracilibacillus auburnensis TaxID=1494959 RepID=A0A2V3VPD7_9BACI|nr:TRAP transporter large permease [Pseudogracilibacillus auburnensis]PXW83390.1 tripartite ATP-independent transporter DctM subunit [Pseudogracilibacillus auburnensis]
MDPYLIIILFVVILFAGMPVAYVLGITGLLSLIAIGTVPLTALPQKMWTSLDSFPLMALPLFILASEIMNHSGITKGIIDLCKMLIGRFRGGLAYTNIASSAIFASISGSASATAAAIGSIMVPAMEKEGYDKDTSAALTASASILGPIIPPSTSAVILGVSAQLSIGALFIAGYVPGILFALGLGLYIFFIGKRRNFPIDNTRYNKLEVVTILKNSIPAILMPLIIIGGILSGVFTATESAAIACLYGILVGMFYMKTLRMKDLPNMFLKAGILTGAINIILGTSNVLGWTITINQIPQLIANWLLNLSENPHIILLLIIVLFLIVGLFMEIAVAIIMLTPILFPIIISLGVDPLHFGIVMLFALTIGMVTPPLGLSLFVMTAVANTSIGGIMKRIYPQIIIAVIVLLIITYIPELTLWLPRLFNIG